VHPSTNYVLNLIKELCNSMKTGFEKVKKTTEKWQRNFNIESCLYGVNFSKNKKNPDISALNRHQLP
jgi:hypothetical protein